MSYLLGDEGMGYFNSAYTVYSFFYIIAIAGIPKAISILCAKASDGEAKSIFKFIYRIYLLIGALLTAILLNKQLDGSPSVYNVSIIEDVKFDLYNIGDFTVCIFCLRHRRNTRVFIWKNKIFTYSNIRAYKRFMQADIRTFICALRY